MIEIILELVLLALLLAMVVDTYRRNIERQKRMKEISKWFDEECKKLNKRVICRSARKFEDSE